MGLGDRGKNQVKKGSPSGLFPERSPVLQKYRLPAIHKYRIL